MMLWLSSTSSNLAAGVFRLALPLYAALAGGGPIQVAGAVAALGAPWLLLSIPVGQLVDTTDRLRLLQLANGARVALLSLATALHIAGSLSHPVLLALAFLAGAAEVVADTAASALLPAVVPRGGLEVANSRIVGAHTVGNEFAGPAVGGFLFALNPLLPLVASASLYGLASGVLVRMRGPGVGGSRRRGVSALLEGFNFLRGQPTMLSLMLLVSVLAASWSAWLALMPLHAVEPGPLGLTAAGYGLLLTCLGIGGVLGAIVAVPLRRRIGTRVVLAIDFVGTAALLGAPALGSGLWLLAAACVLAGAGGTMWGVIVRAYRQRVVPDELLGRTSAALRMVEYGALPIGALVAGALAEVMGIRPVLLLFAAVSLVLAIPFFALVKEQAFMHEEAGAPG